MSADLIARLRELGTPGHADKEKAYHKSSWEHWGVAAPQMDLAIRETMGSEPDDLLPISARLWREPVWDLKIVAARILARKSVAPTEAVWQFVLDSMSDLDGWAVADTLAGVASRCLLAGPRRLDIVEAWVASPHLWTRRASLVFTLPWTKNDRNPERMLGWAARLTPDREWFIQKAIGWWLRELSKRNPARVRRFLDEHGGGMKAFARKEGSKYLEK